MNVLFQIIPDNATSKYKLILLYITVNALKHIYLLSAEQTLTHTILGLRLPLLPPSLQQCCEACLFYVRVVCFSAALVLLTLALGAESECSRCIPSYEPHGTYYHSRCCLTDIPTDIPTEAEWVILSHNDISSVPAGVLDPLTSCYTLNLAFNDISSVEHGAFWEMSSLTYLYLQYNKISLVEAGMFLGMNHLKLLSIQVNNLTLIQNGVFEHLERLETLYLERNRISTIEKEAFSSLSRLSFLNLGWNRLTSIEQGMLSGLGSLRSLIIDLNQIRDIKNGALDPLWSLASLNLNSNRLTTLNPDLFINLPRRPSDPLHLSLNSHTAWNCSSLCWLKLEQTQGTIKLTSTTKRYGPRMKCAEYRETWWNLDCGDKGLLGSNVPFVKSPDNSSEQFQKILVAQCFVLLRLEMKHWTLVKPQDCVRSLEGPSMRPVPATMDPTTKALRWATAAWMVKQETSRVKLMERGPRNLCAQVRWFVWRYHADFQQTLHCSFFLISRVRYEHDLLAQNLAGILSVIVQQREGIWHSRAGATCEAVCQWTNRVLCMPWIRMPWVMHYFWMKFEVCVIIFQERFRRPRKVRVTPRVIVKMSTTQPADSTTGRCGAWPRCLRTSLLQHWRWTSVTMSSPPSLMGSCTIWLSVNGWIYTTTVSAPSLLGCSWVWRLARSWICSWTIFLHWGRRVSVGWLHWNVFGWTSTKSLSLNLIPLLNFPPSLT